MSIFWVIQEIPNQFKSIFFYFFCVYSPKIAKSHIERSLIYRYICTNPHKVKNQLFFFACLGVRTENLALLFALLANWTVPTRLWIFLSVFWYIYLTLPKLPSAISHEILRTKENQEYVINLLFCVESEYAIRFRKYETLYNIFF